MSMTTIDKRRHAFKRRINVRAVTDEVFKDMEDILLESIRYFCQKLVDAGSEPEWSTPRNMSVEISYLLSDTMGDVVFSRNWDVLRSEKNRDIIELLQRGVAGVNLVSKSLENPPLLMLTKSADDLLGWEQTGLMPIILHLKLDKIFFRKETRDVYRFKALSQAQSDWRVAQGDKIKHKDFFSTLMQAKDPESGLGLPHKELISEAGLLIIAGSDTTATTLTATVFYLLHNPQTLQRLQQEIWQAFNGVEEIRMGPALASCRYLTACLTETMRVTPPVGATLPREVCAGGITVDGHHFPAGIDVGVPAYGLHHNADYFPDPYSYKPERWLLHEPGTTEESLARANSAYHPFGVGRTSCIGKRFAYLEMSIILARILWIYEIRLQPGSSLGEGNPRLGDLRSRKSEFQTKDIFVSAHDGPMVEFRDRRVEH